MEIIHNIALDVSRQGIQASIPITRGENGVRKLVITLRNKGAPIELVEGDSAVLYLDTDAFEPVIVYTNKGVYPNSLVYDVTANASATIGQKKATIQISRAYGRITYSPEILLLVTENGTYKSQVLNSPPYAAVLKAQAQAEEYCRKAEEKIESVEPRLEQMADDYNEKISQTNEDLEEGLNQKLDKKSYTDYMRVYGTHPDGRQGMFLVSPAVLSSGAAIIMRDINGNADIGDPTKPAHIANKKYVDSTVASAENNFTERADTLEGDLNTAKSELKASISEVESIAKGATQAESFFDYEEMVEKLNVAPRDTYRIGQSLFINTRNVPDLWVFNMVIGSPINYTYTSDESFVEDLKKGYVTVGYFTLAPLETQKVDLTGYPTTEEVASIVKSVTYDKKEIDRKVASITPDNIYANIITGTESGAVVSMDDVSPLIHKVKAKTRGKNLLSVESNGYKQGITYTVLDSNSFIVEASGEQVAPSVVFWEGTLSKGYYTLSFDINIENNHEHSDANRILVWINNELCYIEPMYDIISGSKVCLFNVTNDNTVMRLTYYINSSNTTIEYNNYKATLTNIQLEKGSVATDFAPYVPNDTQITVTSLGKNLLCVNPNGYYHESVATTVFDNNSFAVEATGIQHSPQYSFWEGKLSAGQYSLSFDIDIENNVITSGSNKVYFWFNNTFETLRGIGENVPTTFKATFTVPNDNTLVRLTYYINVDDNVEYNNYKATLTNIQLEKGSVATEYEPYAVHESVITTIAEGAELNSVAPNMTITTDTQGVIIDAEYNKDTNKVIEKLTQAIISLGGNI